MANKNKLNGGTQWLDRIAEELAEDFSNDPPDNRSPSISVRERLVALETSVKSLWKVFPVTITVGMSIVGLLVLLTSNWTTNRLESIESQFTTRLDSIESRVESRFTTLEQKIDAIPAQLTSLANAIATNITATKQPAPIVIYSQPPQSSSPPSSPPRSR